MELHIIEEKTINKIDIDNRVLILNEDVTADNINEICIAITKINNHDNNQDDKYKNYERKPIKLIVDSYGGSVYDGFGLINMITSSKTPIHTYCYSKAMSMGFMIFISGHKRFAHEYSTLMMHQPSGFGWGKLKDRIEDINETKRLYKKITKIILNRTNITEKQLNKIYKRKKDWFISGKKAVKLNVADEYIQDQF